ncbi:4Fe-4S binding protein [Candidatus Latescibacterota bacterium]
MEKNHGVISRQTFLQKSVQVGVAGLTAHVILEGSAAAQGSGTTHKTVNFDTWCGIDRKTIQWNPVVDESKCVGCGLCVATCGRKVYRFDFENKKSKVVEPTHCMVACNTCANLCPVGAISFSKGEMPREKAQKIVQEHNVKQFAQAQLESRKDELAYKPNK